ncbi:uncharacterized protein OCT59_004552 [Rhizophagus irregularis]|uniref:uncharacterized protein n=1 Tax=Rhizophagus irregularis TaxID=588596 RepID=UPI00331E9B1F|nr:hypothetical protein OCT59_004552 [Rhizophagus irregularis]
MAINREILKSQQNPYAVSVIPELVGHILEYIPSRNFGTHLLEVSPIWRAEAKRVLWKRHKKAEEAYDRAVEKKEKANDALGQSLEEEGILHELEWEAYQKACKERTNAAVEHIIVKEAIRRCNLQL